MLHNRVLKVIFVVLFCMFLCLEGAQKSPAMFVDMQEAQDIVESWLMRSKGPISDEMGEKIRDIVHYHGGIHGEPGYYIAFLEPNGWVAVPADDSLEVIRAFGTGVTTSKDYANSRMPHFLMVDLPPQLMQPVNISLLSTENSSQGVYVKNPRKKRWDFFRENQGNSFQVASAYSSSPGFGKYLNEIENDIVVLPILGKNNWGQSIIGNKPFYNYQISDDNKYYPVGCVPLSVAQVMRHFKYPDKALVPATFIVSMDSHPVSKDFIRTKRPYDWSDMPIFISEDSYSPALEGIDEFEITSEDAKRHRDEISVLLHDVGIALRADYSSITGASTYAKDIPGVLKNHFYYKNAIYNVVYSSNDVSQKMMLRAINSNLNMGLPVIIENLASTNFNTTSPDWSGHAPVVDGYAYLEYGSNLGSVIYHHVNFGWDGIPDYTALEAGEFVWKDVWFDLSLPINRVTASDDPTNRFVMSSPNGVVFNIMPDVTNDEKEIVSGRVLNVAHKQASAQPAMEVVFETTDNTTHTATTNEKGVFAFKVSPTVFEKVTLRGAGIKEGDITEPLKHIDKDYFAPPLRVIESKSTSIDNYGSVGNLYYEKIFLKTAVITGVENGLMNGVSELYDIPYPFASPLTAGNNWDFSGLTALYIDPFPYDLYVALPWYGTQCGKIRDFVLEGGTLYLTGDSHPLASYLSFQAGIGLLFHASPPYGYAALKIHLDRLVFYTFAAEIYQVQRS